MSTKYLGVKIILAIAMTREAFETLHGRNVGGDLHGDGYEVEYENGYKAWSPKEVFDAAYRPIDGLTFGLAIEALKMGKKVARAGWNGKGGWLRLVLSIHDIPRSGTNLPVYRLTCEDDATALPWIGMKTADNKFVPWLASQTDMLAEDWQVVD